MASAGGTLTHIGGPTALIDFSGIRLLTDPTFDPAGADYVTGPVTLRKLSGPALSVHDVGAVDAVLLSHDHHADNLDQAGRTLLQTARTVLTTEEGATRLGGAAVGLRPWQTVDLPGAQSRTLRVVATPARHGPAEADRGPVIGFALFFTDTPEEAIYFSGDTVWYDGVAEVAQRFSIRAAILNLGAARVSAVGPFPLTMTAGEAVEAARAFSHASIIPLHFEGWAHFSEGREEIARAFTEAGLSHRLRWPEPGRAIPLGV
jgi:L-ascorbate metabolism protein UlaG (beta-lactamase superfamily)